VPKQSRLPDEDLVKRICNLIEGWQHPGTAARIAGVPRSTFNYWMDRGERDEAQGRRSRYATFYRRVDAAIATAEGMAANTARTLAHGVTAAEAVCPDCARKFVVQVTTPRSLKAATFYLERTHPDRWGRRDVHRHELANHLPIADVAVLITDLGMRTRSMLEDVLRAHAVPAERADQLLEDMADAWEQLVSAKFPALSPGDAVGADGASADPGEHRRLPPRDRS
jgi:hypothetical protein